MNKNPKLRAAVASGIGLAASTAALNAGGADMAMLEQLIAQKEARLAAASTTAAPGATTDATNAASGATMAATTAAPGATAATTAAPGVTTVAAQSAELTAALGQLDALRAEKATLQAQVADLQSQVTALASTKTLAADLSAVVRTAVGKSMVVLGGSDVSASLPDSLLAAEWKRLEAAKIEHFRVGQSTAVEAKSTTTQANGSTKAVDSVFFPGV